MLPTGQRYTPQVVIRWSLIGYILEKDIQVIP